MDVTEQYEAEEALHMATRQRELILESVGDGIFGIDLDGKVTFINEAGARALGYAPDQLTGRDLHDLIHHSHADGTPYSRSTSPILQALRRSEPIRMRDEVFWRRNGSAIQVEYSANPLMEDGQVSGMVVAFQDVSERRRLERMKDEFISTVSHELRTPLTSLRASLGLIQSGALDKRPEKQRQMVEMAIGNCDRLTRLVNDILDFDGAEKRRLPLNREPVEAIDLLRRAADVAHGAATQARMEFRIEAKASPVFADSERVMQVLNELVTNAIKFSPPGTTIHLSARDTAGERAEAAARQEQKRCALPWRIKDAALRRRSWSASSSPSSRATRRTRGRWAAQAWAWRFAAASWSSTAGASGPKANWATEAGSCLRCRRHRLLIRRSERIRSRFRGHRRKLHNGSRYSGPPNEELPVNYPINIPVHKIAILCSNFLGGQLIYLVAILRQPEPGQFIGPPQLSSVFISLSSGTARRTVASALPRRF